MQALLELGVQTGIHYPTPIHLMGMYEHLGHNRGAFPVAEESSARALSLPIYPGLTQGEQLRVVRAMKQVLAKK
jgi:dTDP-4-amino-4,6-dideoxygalactose transaminase